MNSKRPARTNRISITVFLSLFFSGSLAASKGDGPFSFETSVTHTNSSKTKGTLKLTVSYSDGDAVIKVNIPKSEDGCYSTVKTSQIFRGWKTKKQIRRTGTMEFKIVSEARPCDLVLEVEANEGSVIQSMTRTIHLRDSEN